MKLCVFEDPTGSRLGVIQDGRVHDAGPGVCLSSAAADWPAARPAFAAALASGQARPVADVRLRAPIARPGKIFAIGLNYADHVAESGQTPPTAQTWFTKAATSVNAPCGDLLIPGADARVDYEVELVAVVGRGGKHISRSDAAAALFGYCVGNDVTERSWQFASSQWCLGKSFDTHGPIGPWITTCDEVADPHALDIRCWVNGEQRQASNTRHLIFDVFAQIARLSGAMTLEPGDLIFTGTPGGVGAAMTPRRFLAPGDVVRCEIEGLGALENRCVLEPAA